MHATMERYKASTIARDGAGGNGNDDDDDADLAVGAIDAIKLAAARRVPAPNAPPAQERYNAAAVCAAVDELQREMNMTFNAQQHFAISIAAVQVLQPGLAPLRMCVVGDAGCGKTVFAKAFRRLIDKHRGADGVDPLKIMAWTGSAARTAGGQTVCDALQIGPYNRTPVCSATTADSLRAKFKGVRYLIIDEVSLLSARALVVMDHRLRVATGRDANPLVGCRFSLWATTTNLGPSAIAHCSRHCDQKRTQLNNTPKCEHSSRNT